MSDDQEAEIRRLLDELAQGRPGAFDELVTLIHEPMKRLAHRINAGFDGPHSLQTTALVAEAYLKLNGRTPVLNDEQHLFAVLGRAMRQVIVDHVRKRARRQARLPRVERPLDAIVDGLSRQADLLGLDEALAALEVLDPTAVALVELRFFGAYTAAEAAEALGLSSRTADRTWAFARTWLARRLKA